MSTLKLRVLPKFPSRIVGDDGITVEKNNGIWTISLSDPVLFNDALPFTPGDMFFATGPNTVDTLAAVAVGNVLKSAGVGAGPAWGPIDFVTVPGTAWDGVTDDSVAVQAWITAGLAAGQRTFVWPAGKVLLGGTLITKPYPDQSATFDAKFITLIDNIGDVVTHVLLGTDILVVGGVRGEWGHVFGAHQSAGLRVAGFGTVDYVNLPYTQGTVVHNSIAVDGTTIDINLDSGFTPTFADVLRLEQIDDSGDTGLQLPVFVDTIFTMETSETSTRTFTNVSGNRWRITATVPADKTAILAIDDSDAANLPRFLITHQIFGADVVHVRDTDLVEITGNLTVYTTAGMLLRVQQGKQVDFSGLKSRQYPDTNRMITATGGGMILGFIEELVNAQGFYFWGLMDDPINIMTQDMTVTAVAGAGTDANTFKAGNQPYPYTPPIAGDHYALVKQDGTIVPMGRLDSFSLVGGVYTMNMVDNWPVGMAVGDKVYPSRRHPVVTIDGTMEWARGHGVVFQSRGGTVRGTYRNIAGSAIQCRFYPGFFAEGIVPERLTIDIVAEECNAQFDQAMAVINVYSLEITPGVPDTPSVISDISISGRVTGSDQAAIAIIAANGVDIQAFSAYAVNRNPNTGVWALSQDVIGFKDCTNVKVSGCHGTGTIGFEGTNTNVLMGHNPGLTWRTAPASIKGWNHASTSELQFWGQNIYFPHRQRIDLHANLGVAQDYPISTVVTQFTAANAVGLSHSAGVVTITAAGRYLVTGSFFIYSAGSGAGRLSLQKNGVDMAVLGSDTSVVSIPLNIVLECVVNDTLRLICVLDAINLAMFSTVTYWSVDRLP